MRIRGSALLASVLAFVGAGAHAQFSDGAVRIGILNDQSGLYEALTGRGSVIAARMAIEDAGGTVGGRPVEVVIGDHQNKADIGASLARRWIDEERVDAIFDVPNSAVAIAVLEVARQKNRVVGFSGPVSPALTGAQCAPTAFSWTWDTFSLANTTARALVVAGMKNWYFVTLDSAAGAAMEGDARRVVESGGGKVLGGVKHPLNISDFSSFLLQAQASKAQVVALANAGADTVNAIKQAAEYRLTERGQKVASLLLTINDVHGLGLPAAKGVVTAESFYWDLDDETRAWTKRFQAQYGGPANMVHAGVYSVVLHYLKAAKAANTDDSATVAAKMKELPVNDFYTKNVKVQPNGRLPRDMYLFEVKSPTESKGAWDYYRLVGKVPGQQAYRPAEESGCPLVKK
ncbi:MAG: ABC transporter substrate-binding protein [Burkholderiaceae bacterium]